MTDSTPPQSKRETKLRERMEKRGARISALMLANVADREQLTNYLTGRKDRANRIPKIAKPDRPAPTSVPDLFPRLKYAAALWAVIKRDSTEQGTGYVVRLSLTKLAKEWATPRATVKHLITAFIGRGILTDLSPRINVPHVYKVSDPFGELLNRPIQHSLIDEDPNDLTVAAASVGGSDTDGFEL